MSKNEEDEEVNQEERDRLLYELVLRQSAVESLLLKKGILSGPELAESQMECMAKLEAVISARANGKNEQDPQDR